MYKKQKLQSQNNTCARCGKVQEGNISFMIGSSGNIPAWCLCEGTGRFVCPECYPAEMAEGRKIIDNLTA